MQKERDPRPSAILSGPGRRLWGQLALAVSSAVLLGLVLSSCSRPARPARPAPASLPARTNGAAIGLEIVIKAGSIYVSTYKTIVLARLNDSGKPIRPEELVIANYASNAYYGPQHFYVLNVEPGKYALVAIEFRQRNYMFFSRPAIAKLTVTAEGNALRFLGRIVVDLPGWNRWSNPDQAQVHYAALIRKLLGVDTGGGGMLNFAPKTYGKARASGFARRKANLVTMRRDPAAETAFLKASRKILAGEGWNSQINARLAELQ